MRLCLLHRVVCDGLVKEVAFPWRCQDGEDDMQRSVCGLEVVGDDSLSR